MKTLKSVMTAQTGSLQTYLQRSPLVL